MVGTITNSWAYLDKKKKLYFFSHQQRHDEMKDIKPMMESSTTESSIKFYEQYSTQKEQQTINVLPQYIVENKNKIYHTSI